MEDEPKNFRTLVIEWVNDGVAEGLSPFDAAVNATAKIIETKFANEALQSLGPPAFAQMWRVEMSGDRRESLMRGGSRRNSLTSLNDEESLLEKMINLGGGVYRPWGDLTKADCEVITSRYQVLENGIRSWRRAWTDLGQGLKKGETVRQKFTDDQLRSKFKGYIEPAEPVAALV